jgi:hypothetical protein
MSQLIKLEGKEDNFLYHYFHVLREERPVMDFDV